MSEKFKCSKCGNEESKYIGYRNGEPYCRKCISFNGAYAEVKKPKRGSVVLNIAYPLSDEQKRVSDGVYKNYIKKKDTLINAVCGAGKTELVYQVIAYCLSQGGSVAFAVPRRDVVIELYHRIKETFPSNSVIALYGGNTSKLEADIVVLTTHQMYRYPKYFDLVVLDEIDAFPFKGDQLLHDMFFRSVKGNIVMMSATPSKEVIEYFSAENREILELNTRFHKHPLAVPQIIKRVGFLKVFWLLLKLRELFNEGKRVFIFAPTINECEKLYKFVHLFIKEGAFVHSKCKDRTEIITKFKNNELKYLVTTAVLERGVTFAHLQVIIYDADNDIYDSQALIQISGRVGRKMNDPEGEIFLLVNKTTDAIDEAILTIKRKNEYLQNLLQRDKRNNSP